MHSSTERSPCERTPALYVAEVAPPRAAIERAARGAGNRLQSEAFGAPTPPAATPCAPDGSFPFCAAACCTLTVRPHWAVRNCGGGATSGRYHGSSGESGTTRRALFKSVEAARRGRQPWRQHRTLSEVVSHQCVVIGPFAPSLRKPRPAVNAVGATTILRNNRFARPVHLIDRQARRTSRAICLRPVRHPRRRLPRRRSRRDGDPSASDGRQRDRPAGHLPAPGSAARHGGHWRRPGRLPLPPRRLRACVGRTPPRPWPRPVTPLRLPGGGRRGPRRRGAR